MIIIFFHFFAKHIKNVLVRLQYWDHKNYNYVYNTIMTRPKIMWSNYVTYFKAYRLYIIWLNILSTCYFYSKTPSSSTYHLSNSLVPVIFVIIKLPPFNFILLSPSGNETLYIIKLIKQNGWTIRFIKRLLANQRLIWFDNEAKRVNSCLIIPLKVPLLHGNRMISSTLFDLFLECQYQFFSFDSLLEKQSLTVVK